MFYLLFVLLVIACLIGIFGFRVFSFLFIGSLVAITFIAFNHHEKTLKIGDKGFDDDKAFNEFELVQPVSGRAKEWNDWIVTIDKKTIKKCSDYADLFEDSYVDTIVDGKHYPAQTPANEKHFRDCVKKNESTQAKH